MIYLDNAATTLMKPQEVAEAVVASMTSLGNAGRGGHDSSLQAARVIYEAREALCTLFGGSHPRQLVFTANSTESLNIAIYGLIEPGDRVVTTAWEHNSVLRPLYVCEEKGAHLTVVDCDENGKMNYERLEAEITMHTKAVVCTAGSNLTGDCTDLMRIGEIARSRGAYLIVDASQAAGIFPIDVEAMHIDVLCFTGHKALLGPQGTGGMWVREGVPVKPLLVGGSGIRTYSKTHPEEMPTALEAGTLNGHGIAGLLAGVRYIERKGMSVLREKELALMQQFYEGIREVPGIRIYGDFSDAKRCPIVSINLGDYDSAEVSDQLLTEYGIATRSGGHCAPLLHQALGTVEQGAVRFSFSHMNTAQEVESAIRAVWKLASES